MTWLILAQPMFIQAQEASDAAAEGSSSERQRTFQFPGWAEPRKVVRKERIPPAPPGPYMSSALSGSSVDGPSFSPANKPAIKFGPPDLPMQAFYPDTPWPSNSTSPDRWKPEKGYNYVKPPVKRQPYPAMPYNMPPNYNYGYRAPVMNWPGPSSHTMPFRQPSAGMNSNRSGAARPSTARPSTARPSAYAPE
jgi:hypothetical protein